MQKDIDLKILNPPLFLHQCMSLSKNNQLLIVFVSLFKDKSGIILYVGFATPFYLIFLDVHVTDIQ